MSMKLEQQVTSLEISKKLKELGVKQDSLFYWNIWGDSNNNPYITHSKGGLVSEEIMMKDYLASAFTVAELGEMLPTNIEYENKLFWLFVAKDFLHNEEKTIRWQIKYQDHNQKKPPLSLIETSEADARGKMLIYLLENNLLQDKPKQ